MDILNELINLFGTVTPCISERIGVLEVSFQTMGCNLPKEEQVIKILANFPFRDHVKLTLTNEVEANLVYDNHTQPDPDSVNEFYSYVEEQDNIRVSLDITKKIDEDSLSIYNFVDFSRFLLSKNLIEVLDLFTKLLEHRNTIFFELYDWNEIFFTNSIVFKSSNSKKMNNKFVREEQFNNCRQSSCFYNINDFYLIPDDFEIIMNCSNNPLEKLFNQVKTILSLIYISDSAFIDNKILSIQILGQRNLSKSIFLDSMDLSTNEELFRIYKWIYTDGNVVDKAAIARNVLSLHCKYTDIFSIDEKTFASMLSNFRLYQRNNVSQYIAVKNKLADYILEVANSTSDIIIGLSDKMKSNFIAVVSFLFTVVLVNIVSSAPLDNIFTKDITFLIDLILLGSFGYLFFSIKETNYKLQKIINGYNAIKENYKDLLDEQDIELIFNNDELINSNIREIKKKKDLYTKIWIVSILSALVLFELVSADPFISSLIVKLYKGFINAILLLKNIFIQLKR